MIRWPMLLFAVVAVVAGGAGCYVEAAGTYYPVVQGGSRVQETGWGFAFNVGINLKYARVRGQFGRGVEVAAAGYEDATGSGNAGYLAGPWHARVDAMIRKLGTVGHVADLWADLTVGGTWGGGLMAVDYGNELNPAVESDAWSIFGGPALHYAEGESGDIVFAVAPIVLHATSPAHDPFTSYGVTGRITIALGINPPGIDLSDWGIVKLFRAGRDPEGADKLDRTIEGHRRRQGDSDERRRDEQERQRKERERCRRTGDC